MTAARTLKRALRGALLAPLSLAACVGSQGMFGEIPTARETLDGNYRTLANCTFQKLARREPQLQKNNVPDQPIVRISPSNGDWAMSFIDEDSGRTTLLEMKSSGAQATDHAMAIARACSA